MKDSRILKFITKHRLIPALVLLAISLSLALTNFTPGTYLSGWDTLHPEFNFSLAFQRIFFGTWRQEQGLGAPAIHSHIADLPRTFLLWLSSLFLPTSLLRYFFFFTALISGPLGVYFFLQTILRHIKNKPNLPSFLGALYYLLNLATLQIFYVPFEMFAVQYALLPWLFLFIFKYLRSGKKKTLKILAVVSLLSASMAFAATLFYGYFFALILFLVVFSLIKKSKTVLKRSILIILLVLATNAFWLLPNFYSITSQGNLVNQAQINQNFSQDAFLANREYGKITDVIINKGYLFSWKEFDDPTNQHLDLLNEWKEYQKRPFVMPATYAISLVLLLGVAFSLTKRSKLGLAFFPILLLSLFFLINQNFPTATLFAFLRDNFSIFKEGFRMPFTKFSAIFLFVSSFYFTYAFLILPKKLKKSLALATTAALIFTILPAFRGNLISPSMRTQIPQAYFDLFDWSSKQINSSRIAKLPLNTLYGWNYYNWDYEGAGFVPFGLNTPLLDRDFDRWSPYNETFYNQASFALYSQDLPLFEETLKKYQVKYLLLDESIINAGGDDKLLFNNQFIQMADKSSHIKKIKQFSFLTLYQTDYETGDNFIWTPQSYTLVNANLTYSQIDPIYSKYSNYIQSEAGVGHPFVNFDLRADVQATIENNQIKLTNNLLDASATFPAVNIISNYQDYQGTKEAKNCSFDDSGEIITETTNNKIIYSARDGGINCDYFIFPNLNHSEGYLLRIKGTNIQGRSLKLYLQNHTTGRIDTEKLLPQGEFDQSFVILPTNNNTRGYTLNLETRSFGHIASKNTIDSIEVYPLPVDFLLQVHQEPKVNISKTNNLKVTNVKKINPTHYVVKTQGEGLLVLGQGYEKGWVAFQKGKKLNHFKVNSWENGWEATSGTVHILYYPQFFEYLGFVILITTFAYLLIPLAKLPRD